MKKKILIFGIALALFSSLFYSCVKEEFNFDNITDTDWDPNFAGHIINSHLTMWDIMNNYDSTDLLVIDSTHFVYLVYEDTVYSETAENLISINNQSVTLNNALPLGNYNGDIVFEFDHFLDLAYNDPAISLDSMILKTGTLEISMFSDLSYPATLEVSIPGSTQNGLPFSKVLNYTSSGSSNINNLDNSKIVFNPTQNRIPLHFKLTVHGNGAANNSTYANFTLRLNNPKYKFLFGYLGQIGVNLNHDTVSVRIYNNAFDGTVQWEDPRLYVNIYNGWGLPVRSNVDYLEAKQTKPPFSSVPISGSGIISPWDLNYPTQIGQVAKSSIALNKNNSNINDALNITPQLILALISGTTNPNGNVVKNFVEDNSLLAIEAKLELPFYGKAKGFTLRDTIDFSFGKDLKNIEWILFKINVTNLFPVDGLIQLYFCDSANVRVDSLLKPMDQLIIAAQPGPAPDYIVKTPTKKFVSQTIGKDRMGNLEKTKKFVVEAKLDTYNNATQLVKIYSYYYLDVQLSTRVQTSFNSSEL